MIRQALVPFELTSLDQLTLIAKAYRSDELVVFFAESDKFPPYEFNDILTESEKVKANKYLKEVDRQAFTVGRGVLRSFFLQLNATGLATTDWVTNAYGKPLSNHPQLNFNYAHSEGWVAWMVSKTVCGVDIQKLPESYNWQEVAKQVFPKSVVETIDQSPHPLDQFLSYWTRYEAYCKMLGTGISEEALSPSLYETVPNLAVRANLWLAWCA